MIGCDPFKSWSSWLQEGYYISYLRDGLGYYEHIVGRDLGHYMYAWPETISATSVSGPFTPDELEITRGYDKKTNMNRVWQMIFGIKGQAYIYIELPTDIHRHGIPKAPKPTNALREVSHFEEYMTPFFEPSFITEHFLMRPEVSRISFDSYNPNAIDLTDVQLNIFIAKMMTERIGYQYIDETGRVRLKPTNESRWGETLQKLYKRLIPHRPITLLPVRAPAEAPGGE